MFTSFFEALHRLVAVDETGRAIGEVRDLVIESESLKLVALRIALHRGIAHEVGARPGLFRAATVDVPVRYVRAAADGVLLLALSAKELARLVAVDAAGRALALESLAARRTRLH